MTIEGPAVSGEKLLQAWRERLPHLLQPGDGHQITLDEKDPDRLLVHIAVSGHELYSMDFHLKYVDDREVDVKLADVQRGNKHIDERQEDVQELIRDYVRRIRECAQQLQPVTHL